MSKIAITADIHLGVPGRLDDILYACRTIREYCNRAEIDTVLVLGDLFHDRESINIEVLYKTNQFFEATKKEFNQTWIAFPGNHDMFLRHSWNINSISPLKEYITIIDTIKILELDDKRFWVVPFITNEKAYAKVISTINDMKQENDTLLTHIGVTGSTLNTCFLLKEWSIISFEHSNFKRVYTGHFHSQQQVGHNVWYPGSPIPFKFDEGDIPHGFYVYDLETETHKFANIWKAGKKFFPDETPPPQFCTLSEESIESVTEEDIASNIIRVALTKDYTNDEKRILRDKLLKLGAKSVRWMNIFQRVDKLTTTSVESIQNKDLFQAWVAADTTGIKNLDLKTLNSLNNEIVMEGDELYAIEEAENSIS